MAKTIKRREGDTVSSTTLIPDLKTIRSWRSGHIVSRIVRHIVEHKLAPKLLGANLAVAALATSFLPQITPALTASSLNSASVVVDLSTEPIKLATEKSVQLPLESFHLNQSYNSIHPGLDLKGTTGDPIRPVMIGKVEAVERSIVGYGNAVLVNHGDGISTLYAHMSKILVKEGDEVKLDTIIGQVGSTGRSTGPHLHLEVRENGRPINPMRILPVK